MLLPTNVIPMRQISATSSESIVQPPVRIEGNFSMFPSDQDTLSVFWYGFIILGAGPSSTCDVVFENSLLITLFVDQNYPLLDKYKTAKILVGHF